MVSLWLNYRLNRKHNCGKAPTSPTRNVLLPCKTVFAAKKKKRKEESDDATDLIKCFFLVRLFGPLGTYPCGFRPKTQNGPWAMGQNPNRLAPSERPIFSTKEVLKWVVNSLPTKMGSQNGFDNHSLCFCLLTPFFPMGTDSPGSIFSHLHRLPHKFPGPKKKTAPPPPPRAQPGRPDAPRRPQPTGLPQPAGSGRTPAARRPPSPAARRCPRWRPGRAPRTCPGPPGCG